MTNSLASQSLRKVRMTVAALAVAVSASVSAQTLITPDLMAPPSAYNVASTGFVWRVYQIATNMPSTSVGDVQRQLNGDFGPNIATPGPNADGSYDIVYVDYDVPVNGVPTDDTSYPGANNLPYPGITPVEKGTNLAVEIIGYVRLPAGTNQFFVKCNDSFRLTLGSGDNPYDYFSTQVGVRSPGGAVAETAFTFNVTTAGVYPLRLLHGQGAGGATLELYYYNAPAFTQFLINDPGEWTAPTVTAYRPASLPITPAKAYVSVLTPFPGQQNVFPRPNIAVQITDAGTTVNTNTITLAFDGAPVVNPLITKNGKLTAVSYQVPTLLPSNTQHTNTLVFTDSSANVTSNSWTFVTDDIFVIPASWAYPTNSGDVAAKGFSGKVHLAQANAGFTAVIASTDARLRDSYVAFSNLAQTVAFPAPGSTNTVNNDFTYTRSGPINYSMDATASAVLNNGQFNDGNGYPDTIFPGCPGATDATRATWTSAANLAWAEWSWVQLPQGLVQINIGHFDAGQVAIHANDPRDIFRKTVVLRDSNNGNQTDSKLVFVEQAGIYGFRCATAAFGTAANLWFEFYVSDPFDANDRTLIGDAANPTYAAYTQLTVPTRPYIDAVRPDIASSGASLDTSIEVDVVNMGSENPVMKVNGQPVVYTTSTVGDVTTLSYTPDKPFRKAAGVLVSIEYGTATSTWSFFTTSGLKALVVGNEKSSIRERLAAVHKLDVTQLAETDAQLLDTNFLASFVLIWNSEAVNSGNAAPYIRLAREMPIPAINVESANASQNTAGNKSWFLGTSSGNVGGANVQNVVVTDPNFGLPLGTNRITKVGSPNGTWHAANLGETGTHTSVGHATGDGNENAWAAVVFEAGTVQPFNGPDGTTPFVMPARRGQMAMAGQSMIDTWNDNAWVIFDKVVEYMLPPRMKTALQPNGKVQLGWTGTGQLQEKTGLSGAWTPSQNQNNPQEVTPSGIKFYRVAQ